MPRDADLKARLAYAIRAAREQAGLSRPELADLVGVNRGAVYTWEKGSSVPSMLNLGALADALGVSADLFAHPPAVPENPVALYLLRAVAQRAADAALDERLDDAAPTDRAPLPAQRQR